MLFFYLDSLQNQAIVTSRCMRDIFFQGGKVNNPEESVLPGAKKEGKGKGNGPSALWWKIDAQTCVHYFIKLG